MSAPTQKGPEAGFAAVILAGGRGTRLDGADKASVEVDGRTLLAHAIEAVADAVEVVVVGEQVPTERPVTFTVEDPRHGGPAAALLSGVDALLETSRFVAVVAVDMPRVTAGTLMRLHSAAMPEDADGSVLVDDRGRRQLTMLLRRDRLEQVRPGAEEHHNLPLHRLLEPLQLVDVDSTGSEHRDIDTWADLRDLAGG